MANLRVTSLPSLVQTWERLHGRIAPNMTTDGEDPGISQDDLPICIACISKKGASDLVNLKCGHSYCASCLEALFIRATKEEESYPPACCSVISLKTAQRHLPKALVRKFKAKHLEFSTKTSIYCHKPTCSEFIKPYSIHNGSAICQKCLAKTCAKCKGEWHFGPCAAVDDNGLAELARSKRWQRCPQCRTMVEKVEGCSHIVCRCGCPFCYSCGKKSERCDCHADDMEDEAFEYIPVLRNLHQMGYHQNLTVVREEGVVFGCDLCYGDFRDEIFQCDDCGLRICNRCPPQRNGVQ